MTNFVAKFETADGMFSTMIEAKNIDQALVKWEKIRQANWFLDSIGPEFKMVWPDWA